MGNWALDLGTTNTGLAHWDEASGQPQLVELPGVCRKPRGDDRLEAPALVPSVVELLRPASLLEHIGRRMGFALEELSDQEEMRLWRRLMLAEACRVKEAVFVEPSAEFLLTPPGLSRRLRRGAPGAQPTQLTRDDLVQVLRQG